MLHKATLLFEQLQQSMFFVANDTDRLLAIDRDHCSLKVALLKQDADGVQLALGKLCTGNSPEALWKAAAILQSGVIFFSYCTFWLGFQKPSVEVSELVDCNYLRGLSSMQHRLKCCEWSFF
jgi:hypothetical protein